MVALERSTRRKIFYLMVLTFALIAPIALLYSRGYILDFRKRGLVQTGGVFVKAFQSEVKVFIDSEFKNETAFISRGTLITNLLPKRYTVRVEKEGFRAWQKVVRVSSQEVLEFRNVLLPPATITPRVVFNTRQRSPARLIPLAGRPEFGVVLGEPAPPATVFIVDPATHRARINFIQVSEWSWDQSSRTFTIARRGEGRTQWYRLAFSADGSAQEVPITFRGLPAGFSAERVTPHPTAQEQLYFFAGGALFLQARSSVPVPIAEQLHTYAVAPEHLYFISKNGFFVESDLEGREAKILGRKGLFLNDERPAEIVSLPTGDVLVLDSAGGLFLYQAGRDQELELIVGNVSGVDFSENGERLLIRDEHRVWMYWLRDNQEQPFDLARTKRQIFYSDEPIRQAFLTARGSHVLLAAPRSIRMTEVDDRGSTNTYTLVEAPIDGFVFDRENLVFYWLQGSTIYQGSLQ